MKTAFRICAAAAASVLLATPAMADGFYAGGQLGWASEPSFTGQATVAMRNAGYPVASVWEDKGNNAGAEAYFGQWVNANFGWEAGITALGTVHGRIAATSGANTIFTSYHYSAAALSIAVQGGVNVTPADKLFVKGGIYNAFATMNGPTSTVTRYSFGPVVGLGYSHRFAEHWSGQVQASDYLGVRYPDFEYFSPTNNTSRHDIAMFTVGVSYLF